MAKIKVSRRKEHEQVGSIVIERQNVSYCVA